IGGIAMLLHLRRGAFFVPSRRNDVARMLSFLDIKEGKKIVDLGSGDGRLLIALAEAGAEAHGYEHNPILVWQSRRTIKKRGLEARAFVHYRNFWKEDFSSFDAVVLYGIPYIMPKLEAKLRRELRPGTRVVSNAFTFPTWEPVEKVHRVYLYQI
ncbi:MAG: methyltransferase domain-containing protein, partial [bacterium]|nr:methyltransferase domain-containing protein [bacterium]